MLHRRAAHQTLWVCAQRMWQGPRRLPIRRTEEGQGRTLEHPLDVARRGILQTTIRRARDRERRRILGQFLAACLCLLGQHRRGIQSGCNGSQWPCHSGPGEPPFRL